MTAELAAALRSCRNALIAPRQAFVGAPPLAWLVMVVSLALVGMGAACLPRQLHVLDMALAPTGDAPLDAHYALMRSGLTRIMVVERLVPSPTLVLSALFLVLLAEPVTALSVERRRRLWAIAVLGLLPLAVQQVGELAMTWMASVSERPTPGQALALPHQFETGPLLFWRSPGVPPKWLQVVDARVNLTSLWCAGVWAVGLRTIDGGHHGGWHVYVPLASLALAGVVTWQCGPVVLSLVLGTP